MSFWRQLFLGRPKISFKNVDWLEVDSRWRVVETLASTSEQTNAKQAIIQADMLVDLILKQANVTGMTLGERLKNLRELLNKTTYRNLWQAHLKRNELVHDTGSFVAKWELETHLKSFHEAISHLRGLR